MTIAGAGAPRKPFGSGFFAAQSGHDSFRTIPEIQNTLFKTHRQMSTVM
jgi:hypothetical protein